MGSFLEEIIKGGLGNVFGNAGGSTSGGGLEDILKDMTGGQSTTTTSSTTRRSTQDNDLNDILRDIRQNAGASGSAPQRTTTQQVDDTTQGGGLDDVVKDLRRKMGMDVEEEPVRETSRKNTRTQPVEEEEAAPQGGIDLGSLGGLGGILSILLGKGLNLERIIDTIKLMAKTGLFFAHCDGDYTDRERDFVEGFLAGIEQIGSVDDEVKKAVLDSVNHTYTLDEVLEETKQLVAGFNDDERTAILAVIDGFIKKVMRVDNKVESAEKKAYVAWKIGVGLM